MALEPTVGDEVPLYQMKVTGEEVDEAVAVIVEALHVKSAKESTVMSGAF